MSAKQALFFFILFLYVFPCAGQDFKKTFWELNETKDTAAQATLLTEWEKQAPADPEYFVACFNLYVTKSRLELVQIENIKSGDRSMPFTDSAGKTLGYINTTIRYTEGVLANGYACIDKGIASFPDRLDMRFGKIYMLGENMDYEKFTHEIIKTLNHSAVNNNVWLWSDQIPKENAKKFLLDAVQGYIILLFQKNDSSLLPNMKKISETVLKYYPDHIECLSDLAFIYSSYKEYDKSLELLLKAEKMAPEDLVISANLAHVYKLKGENETAIKYYERVLKSSDKEAVEFSQKQIDELKKK